MGEKQMRFKIAESTNIYNAVVNSCKNAGMILNDEAEMCARKKYNEGRLSMEQLKELIGWIPGEEEKKDTDRNFNMLFTGAVKEENLKVVWPYQKFAHFPFSYNIGRKDAMWRNYRWVEEEFPDDYDFCPMTYVFPQDEEEFELDRKSQEALEDNTLWIFKPSASSCGKGIWILDRETPIPANKKGFVISEYVSNPHLIDGLKYDLRVYALVTSFDPLIVYVYEEGLVRLATTKYSLDPEALDNKFIHLTNYSI